MIRNHNERRSSGALALTISALLFLSQPSHAQTIDPEWPCIQVFVPEVMTAIYWPEVIPDEHIGLWKEAPEHRALVEELGNIDKFTDAERDRIEAFAQGLPESTKLQVLNSVADGIVATANARRARFLRGIKKYTKQQIAIAQQIEATLNEISAFDDSTSAERKAEIEETLAWHERVYDQRERSIISLCERPVELEEKLSSVMRELSYHLP